jgi:AraC-like DNA-binding protein
MKLSPSNFSSDKDKTQPLSLTHNDKNYDFFLFKSAALLEINDSLHEIASGSILLRSPSLPLVIKSQDNDSLVYSRVTFKGKDAKKVTILSCIEPNIVLKPLQVHFADSIISKIQLEIHAKNFNWESIVLAQILELLAKTHRLTNHDFVETLPDHAQKLRDLRAEIHERFSKNWKIEDMAGIMKLSTSRFASLYKTTFKISPTEDLIQTRIDQAKKMLSGSKVSVKRVSDACGFESVHYFHRAFKKRVNLTPKHYQNSQFAQEGSVFTTERHFSLDRLTQYAEYSGIIELIDGELRFHGNTSHVSELLGFSQQHLHDTPFINFVAPQDSSIALEGAIKIMNGKNVMDLNINLVHQSGENIPVQFSALLKGKNWYWFMKHAALTVA